MIIDCHGHYTTEPKDLLRWRKDQVDNLKEPPKQPSKASLKVTDDEIRESLEGAQL
jgi:4-oxalmesaconate hydratase